MLVIHHLEKLRSACVIGLAQELGYFRPIACLAARPALKKAMSLA
jgi:hypothetical protein